MSDPCDLSRAPGTIHRLPLLLLVGRQVLDDSRENVPGIVKNLAAYKKDEGKSVNCPIWNWVCKFEVGVCKLLR